MNDRWNDFLSDAGLAAGATEATVRPPPGNGAVLLCDLSSYDLIAFEGPDAVTFLHGQLSSDVLALTAERCQFAAYHSPKGRVLATMLLWLDGDGVYAQVPAELAEGLRKRLAMYILRSKLRATIASDRCIRLGLGGTGAVDVLEKVGLVYPTKDLGLVRNQTISAAELRIEVDRLLRLPGNRFEIMLGNAEAAIALWRKLQDHGAAPSTGTAWRWLTVRSGIAEVLAKTQDQFVAQMLNLELTGAISFTKGCYPGQEIVARSQYRGEVKRRTFLLHVETENPPTEGDPVFGANPPGQEIGSVVLAAGAPQGGTDLLACLHIDLARSGAPRIGHLDGPQAEPRELPYKLPIGT